MAWMRLLTFSHSLGRHHDIFIATCFQFSSVAQSCLTLCDPTDCSIPGFPVHHQLLELAQTHVHRVGDAMQPFHPLSSPSPPTFNLPASGSFAMSQFFTSGGQNIEASASASVLLLKQHALIIQYLTQSSYPMDLVLGCSFNVRI